MPKIKKNSRDLIHSCPYSNSCFYRDKCPQLNPNCPILKSFINQDRQLKAELDGHIYNAKIQAFLAQEVEPSVQEL